MEVEASGRRRRPTAGRGRLLLAAGAAVAGSLTFGGQAAAQYVDSPPPGGPQTDSQTVVQVRGTGGATASPARSDGLPVTGGDVLGLAAMGAGAIVVGGAVLVLRRRTDVA